MEDLILRPERPSQYREMEALVREAFWDKYRPGCAEHLVVHELRSSEAVVPELCLAAEENGELVGGIWYARATIRSGETVHPVLTMGPVCVRPDRQSRGIGAALIRRTLAAASGMAPSVVIYGSLDYYRRFGFRPASDFGITDAEGAECPAILACPLADEVPSGAFDEGEAYHAGPEAADAFDRSFPQRRKHYNSRQLFFFPPSPPPDDPLFLTSWKLRNRAGEVLRKSKVLEAWERIGGKIRGVGSFRSGLMMKHRDLDLHVYTDTLDAARALEALGPVIASERTVGLDYVNHADTEERCLEWHLRLRDDAGETWKIDMIQILAGTKYDGVIEDETEAVIEALTPEFRKRILELKNACPDDLNVCGIEYCRAVISGGVKSWREFMDWRKDHPLRGC